MGRRLPAALILLLAAAAVPARADDQKAEQAKGGDSASEAAHPDEMPGKADEKAAEAPAAPEKLEAVRQKKKLQEADRVAESLKSKMKDENGDDKAADLANAAGAAEAAAPSPAAAPQSSPGAHQSAVPPPGAARTALPPARAPRGAQAAKNAAAAPTATVRNTQAMRRANNAASVLRSALPTPGDSGLGGGPPPDPKTTLPSNPSTSLPSRAELGTPSGPNPAEPRTSAELIMASHTGFAESIHAQGYKVGPGPGGTPAVLTAAGRPATPAQIAALAAALRAEPAALMRRPDFFTVLPRARFEELKTEYRANPSAPGPAFKDIGMSAEYRDFRWSNSCSSLKGGCNPAAADASYRKGEDVAPEALNAVWKKARAKPEEEDKDEIGDYTDEDRREAAAADLAESRMAAASRGGRNLASLLAGFGGFADGARDWAGFGASARAGAGAVGTGGAGSGAGGGTAARDPLATGRPGAADDWTVPSPAIEKKRSRRGAAGLLAGLAAAAYWIRRRRRSA